MSDDDTEPRSGPAQFSLATLFVFVTGAAVACGLIASHVVLGTAAAVALVGGGWAWFALKAGRRRLAYYLATLPMGVAAVPAAAVPPVLFFVLPEVLLRGGPEFWGDVWRGIHSPEFRNGALAILAGMCVAVTLVARLLRQRIRAADEGTLRVPTAMVYWTAVAFALTFSAVALVEVVVERPAFARVGGLLGFAGLFSLILAPIYATITLPVTLPLAIWFRSILRRIDPLPDDWEQRGRLLRIAGIAFHPSPVDQPPQPPPPDEQAPDR